jgi:hypothetical protein
MTTPKALSRDEIEDIKIRWLGGRHSKQLENDMLALCNECERLSTNASPHASTAAFKAAPSELRPYGLIPEGVGHGEHDGGAPNGEKMPGRIPELEPARLNADYWLNAGRNCVDKENAVLCCEQAINAWKNAAYHAYDLIRDRAARAERLQAELEAMTKARDTEEAHVEALLERLSSHPDGGAPLSDARIFYLADQATRKIHGDDYRLSTRLEIERVIREALGNSSGAPGKWVPLADLQRLVEVHRGWCNYCKGNEHWCFASPLGGCSLRDVLNAAPEQPGRGT